MRIALVVPGGFDRTGTHRVVPFLLGLARRLCAAHDVHVFALRHEPAPADYGLAGARVHDLGGAALAPGTALLQLLPRLVRSLRAHGPFDVVHGWHGPAAAVAVLAARRLRVPSVASFAGGELVALHDIGYGLQRAWRGRLQVSLAARAHALTVASRAMQADAQRLGLRAEVVVLGAETARFDVPHTGGGPPLLHVGSDSAVKDRALAIEVASRAGVPMRIVGEPDWCAPHEMAAVYASAQALLVTSRHEAGGVAVLEAATARVPTVGTPVGYVAELAPEAAVAAREPAALAAAVRSLLDDPHRRAQLGEAARAWALAHDADAMARRFEAIYARVVPAWMGGVPQ